METTGPGSPSLGEVLGAIAAWPDEQRLALARAILAECGRARRETPRPSGDLSKLYGLLKYDGPPLSDAEIDAIREERLREKYGPW